PAYEISIHARGEQHQSRHNRIYWRSGDWVGAGPGAHGRLTTDDTRLATEAADAPGKYLQLAKETGIGWSSAESLDLLEQARERAAMGLRVVEGMPVDDVTDLGLAFNAEKAEQFIDLGLLTHANHRLALTPKGRLTADRIASEIAP